MSPHAGKDIMDSDTDENKSTTSTTTTSSTITAATAATAATAVPDAPPSLSELYDWLSKTIQQQLFEHIRKALARVTLLEQERDTLQNDITKREASHKETINKIKQEHVEFRKQNLSDFVAQVDGLKDEKRVLEEKNGQLLTKVEEQERTITSMEKKQTSQEAEIQKLRKDLTEQKQQSKAATKELSETQKKLTEAQKAKAGFDAALKKHAVTVKSLESEAEALKKSLEDCQAQGEKSKKTLDRIKEFVAQPVDMTTEALAGEFDTMWMRCLNFVYTIVSENLSNEVLKDKNTWLNLETSFIHLPLPQSNTPCAKSMRAIVILSVLARALTRYIFTPTYLLSKAGELDDVLSELAAKDSSHERFVRSVLLRPFADGEDKNIATRAERVRDDVVTSVIAIIPSTQSKIFSSNLQSLVESIARTWTKFQNNKTHFRVSLEMNNEIEASAEWKALKLPIDMNDTFAKELPDDFPVVVLFPQLFSVDQVADKPIRPAIAVVSSQLKEAEEENRGIKAGQASAARRSSGTGTRPRTRGRLSDAAQNSGPATPSDFLGHY